MPCRPCQAALTDRNLWVVLLVAFLTGCATPSPPAVEQPVVDPVGDYDLSMSSATQVSDGTMEIRGEPGDYRGLFSVGNLSAVIAGVEVGVSVLHVQVKLPQGILTIRLTGDGHCFAGNWVLGAQRGTITAEKQPRPQGSSGC